MRTMVALHLIFMVITNKIKLFNQQNVNWQFHLFNFQKYLNKITFNYLIQGILNWYIKTSKRGQ